MMRLYDNLSSGNAYKVRLLLHQLGKEFERIEKDIDRGETRTPEFLRINPNGRVPVLEVEPGVHLAESNAIIWYLAEGTAYLPGDRLDRARVLRWLCFERALTPAVAGARFEVMTGRTGADTPFLLQSGREALWTLEQRLTGRDWVALDAPTIADVALFGYTHVARDAGFDLDALPAVRAWLDRVRELPGYVNDLVPYPANARPEASLSIYD